MEQYLIDTNSIADYFSNNLSKKGAEFMDSIIDKIPNISIITKLELLCWKTDSQIERIIKEFINDSIVIDLNEEIVQKCIELRRSKKIKLPDAIIAATCVVLNWGIITNNEKDFRNIKGLKIFNPKKM